eukprot:237394_1
MVSFRENYPHWDAFFYHLCRDHRIMMLIFWIVGVVTVVYKVYMSSWILSVLVFIAGFAYIILVLTSVTKEYYYRYNLMISHLEKRNRNVSKYRNFEETECSICYNKFCELQVVKRLSCGRTYCGACIDGYEQEKEKPDPMLTQRFISTVGYTLQCPNLCSYDPTKTRILSVDEIPTSPNSEPVVDDNNEMERSGSLLDNDILVDNENKMDQNDEVVYGNKNIANDRDNNVFNAYENVVDVKRDDKDMHCNYREYVRFEESDQGDNEEEQAASSFADRAALESMDINVGNQRIRNDEKKRKMLWEVHDNHNLNPHKKRKLSPTASYQRGLLKNKDKRSK